MSLIISDQLFCEKCNYTTFNKKEYKKHLLTKKHIRDIIKKEYICECGKIYNYNASLYNHKKKCPLETQKLVSKSNNCDYEKMITTLIDENRELRKVLV